MSCARPWPPPSGRPDLDLLVEGNDYFRSHKLTWRGGLRYPTLERDPKRPDLLTAIYNADAGRRSPRAGAGRPAVRPGSAGVGVQLVHG